MVKVLLTVERHRIMTASDEAPVSPFHQPKGVWAVALACVVSFMGIGLVDPILPAPCPPS